MPWAENHKSQTRERILAAAAAAFPGWRAKTAKERGAVLRKWYELMQANSELRALVSAFPDYILLLDRRGTILDIKGAQAQALIPRIDAAIKNYRYVHAGDYRIWPGPNSNTFAAWVLRRAGIRHALSPLALGKRYPVVSKNRRKE